MTRQYLPVLAATRRQMIAHLPVVAPLGQRHWCPRELWVILTCRQRYPIPQNRLYLTRRVTVSRVTHPALSRVWIAYRRHLMESAWRWLVSHHLTPRLSAENPTHEN